MKHAHIVYVWFRRDIKDTGELRKGIISLDNVEMVTCSGRIVSVYQRGGHNLILDGPSAREFLVAYTNEIPREIDERFASLLPASPNSVETIGSDPDPESDPEKEAQKEAALRSNYLWL